LTWWLSSPFRRFTWFVSSAKYEDGPDLLSRANPDKAEWIQRAEGFFFTPTVDDIGRFLRVSVDPRDAQGQRGETYSVYSKSIITAGPGTCPFETRQAFTSSVADDRHVRVVSYNILADLYAETEASKTVLHSHCPLYVLNIDYRRQLLVKELLGYKGDIVCLQEVDSKLFVGDSKLFVGDSKLFVGD
jgi:2',5'-phosphodiesterase